MPSRLFLLAALFCVTLTPLITGQEPVYFPPADQTPWGNPYPGLGNVSPGSANPYLTTPPQGTPTTATLYAEETGYSELSPTVKSSDLYLSRFPNKKRTGMFQKINFDALWAPSKSLGITELDLSAMFALPCPTVDSPLLLTPVFTATQFDTRGWDETFYAAGLGLRWIRPIFKDKLTADLGVSMLYSGDFRAGDALRSPAHAAGIWNINPRTKIVLGVIYADRRTGNNIVPMAGLIWTPHEDISVELLIPRMRIAQRIRWFGSAAGEEQSDWLYTALEWGDGSWKGENIGGESVDGRLEYRDVRFLLGYERRTRLGMTLGLEVGAMFDRKLVTRASGAGTPSDSVFMRLRTSF